MSRSHRKRALVLSLAAGSVALTGPVAGVGGVGADNAGSSGASGTPVSEVSWGNNRWHSYSIFNPANFEQPMADATFFSYHNATDVEVSRYADNWTDVDVRVDASNYGTGLNGWVYCPADALRTGSDPLEQCYRQWLKLDTSNTSWMPEDRRKSLSCHEFGHSLGLRHPTAATHDDFMNTCMVQSSVNPNRPVALHGHDMGILNFWY